jgi:rSAM/selenodomain-associated transferase 2
MTVAMPAIAIIIPALNAAATLEATLGMAADTALLDVALGVVDGGSDDATRTIAASGGAIVIDAPRGRGSQMAAGASHSDAPWLFFLHADTRLEAGWDATLASFMVDPANRERAGAFHLRFDDASPAARRLAWIANRRSRWLGLPYGDQGLILSRAFYETLGGFEPIPIMEDVALARKIGCKRLVHLEGDAITDARRYQKAGYLPRMLRNLLCLTSYFVGVPPRWLVRLYG